MRTTMARNGSAGTPQTRSAHPGILPDPLSDDQIVGETARERTVRLATSRMSTIGHAFELIGRMGNTSIYDLDDQDIELLMRALDEGVERAKYALIHHGRFAPTLKLPARAE